MTTDQARSRVNRSDFSRRAEQMFGKDALRTVGRRSIVAFGLTIATIAIGTASAEWWVQDREARTTLKDIKTAIGTSPDNVNQNLDDLHEQQKVQGDVYDPAKDDDTKSKVAEAPDHQDKATSEARACGGKMPDDQKAVCRDIVKLENDRYTYIQDMRKLSIARENELQRIMQERESIGEWEYGKLQSNTNRLLALMAHQRIDQLNMQNAMTTYDDRLRNRKSKQTQLAEEKMDPSNSGIAGQIINAGAQLATLKAALAVADAAHER